MLLALHVCARVCACAHASHKKLSILIKQATNATSFLTYAGSGVPRPAPGAHTGVSWGATTAKQGGQRVKSRHEDWSRPRVGLWSNEE